jgi:hypothetical protein
MSRLLALRQRMPTCSWERGRNSGARRFGRDHLQAQRDVKLILPRVAVAVSPGPSVRGLDPRQVIIMLKTAKSSEYFTVAYCPRIRLEPCAKRGIMISVAVFMQAWASLTSIRPAAPGGDGLCVQTLLTPEQSRFLASDLRLR